ncbi:MAG: hypothetical protein FWD58_03505 [Firmicutes bacterium]|nr:hypothetical protein [Bacillota bacterium]
MTQKITPNGKTTPKPEAPKKPGGFSRFLKFVFVKNFELKLLALFTSALMWALVVGLG